MKLHNALNQIKQLDIEIKCAKRLSKGRYLDDCVTHGVQNLLGHLKLITTFDTGTSFEVSIQFKVITSLKVDTILDIGTIFEVGIIFEVGTSLDVSSPFEVGTSYSWP